MNTQMKYFELRDEHITKEEVDELRKCKFVNVKLINCTFPDDCARLFDGCEYLERLRFTNCNTSNVTNMRWMFCNCDSLKELDLSNFNTSSVKDMEGMFFGCKKLEKLVVDNANCSSLVDGLKNDMLFGKSKPCNKLFIFMKGG